MNGRLNHEGHEEDRGKAPCDSSGLRGLPDLRGESPSGSRTQCAIRESWIFRSACACIRLLLGLGWLLGAVGPWAAENEPEFARELRAAVAGIAVPEVEIARAIRQALWNTNRTAVAVSIAQPTASRLFVFIRQRGGSFQTVDISGVESGNFGKLGRSRAEYTRFETVPVTWLPRDDGYLQVVVRTRAWRGRQRYTVSEPLVIRSDGTPVWR